MVLASDPLRIRLSLLPGITTEHVEAVARLQWLGLPRIARPRTTVQEEHEPTGAILVVRRGWAFASKLLPNGGRKWSTSSSPAT